MIIGITGRAQNGKDSVGRVLVRSYGFKRYAFADALKSMALVLDPIVHITEDYDFVRLSEMIEDRGWEETKQMYEVRRFIQVLGTEAVRDHLGEDAWVLALLKQINQDYQWTFADDGISSTPDGNIVVTDVRFPNEVEAIKDWGGYMWRVVRPDHDNGVDPNHPSEAFVDHLQVDYEIVARNLNELMKGVDDEMRRIDADV